MGVLLHVIVAFDRPWHEVVPSGACGNRCRLSVRGPDGAMGFMPARGDHMSDKQDGDTDG